MSSILSLFLLLLLRNRQLSASQHLVFIEHLLNLDSKGLDLGKAEVIMNG